MRRKKHNILLVDDHHLIRQGLKLTLQSQNELLFNIYDVDSGEKAIDLFQKVAIDIILMDVSMEGISGIEATHQIIEYYPAAKIIALTMHGETFVVKKMVEAGARGFLLKDTEPEEILKAIKTVLGGKRYFTNDIALKLMGLYEEKHKKHFFRNDVEVAVKLNPKDIEIISLIVKQYTTKEIAEQLGVSLRTLENQRNAIIKKVGVKNTAGLVVYAVKNDLLLE
jgi:DNA-binding NarL/FixJ family response regulator